MVNYLSYACCSTQKSGVLFFIPFLDASWQTEECNTFYIYNQYKYGCSDYAPFLREREEIVYFRKRNN